METVYVPSAPNQMVTARLGGVSYALDIATFHGMTYVSISADGEPLTLGVKAVAGSWLIPSRSRERGGNFRFESSSTDYPYYTAFGNGVELVYYTSEEVDALQMLVEGA